MARQLSLRNQKSTLIGSGLALILLAAACGSGSSPAVTSPETSSAPGVVVDEEGTKFEFDSANFVDPTLDTNPFHPLKPGTQWVHGGTTQVGGREVPHGVIVTMTDVIREIDGAMTIGMLSESTDSGEVAQVGMDYMALDNEGNVWILGGYTEDFEGGEFTNVDVAWLGSAEGQEVGVLVPAAVSADTPRWFIGAAPEEAGSVGEPFDLAGSVCVRFGCYEGVHIIQEGEVGAPDNEHKYYAPGVGMVNNVPLDASLHKDRFELYNFLQLSPAGIAEASQTLLDLEVHAREVAADVFGSVPEATRAN